MYPQVVADGQGGAIITWYDYRSGNSDIYAQRLNAAGNIASGWAVNGVAVCTAVNNQISPQLVADGQGGAIITWDDHRGIFDYDIYAQRVDNAGTVKWTLDGVVVCGSGNDQLYPQLVADGQGGAIITWQDIRGGGGNPDIYAQRVDAVGTRLWAVNGVAVCTAANNQSSPQVAADGQGGAIITWQDIRGGGGNPDIYAQRVNAGGTYLWALDGVAVCTAGNIQNSPQVVADGQGGAIITWQDYRSGTDYDIYAQRVNAGGTYLWALDGVAVCTAGSIQNYPQVVADGQGGAIITWQDNRSGTNIDIYTQRVDATGVKIWKLNGFAVCTAGNDQQSPQLESDGQGGAIIAWYDGRTGTTYDIYAQRIYASGWVGAPPSMVPVELSRFDVDIEDK